MHSFKVWRTAGKIRHGPIYENMKSTRKNFTSGLKYCKKNRTKIQNAILTASFKNNNSSQFWKNVKKRSKKTKSIPPDIDQQKSPAYIANLFANKFIQVSGRQDDGKELPFLPNLCFSERFTAGSVKGAIDKLKSGVGHDGIHSNHFKNASDFMISFIAMFFNPFGTDGYSSTATLYLIV